MMERTKYRDPSAILTADWHLREDTPICFTGDFQTEQWLAVATVAQLQSKYKCPVIHTGDLFHHWKPSPWLLTQAIDLMPEEFYTVYGQHDLPQHNWELRGKSGIKTLEIANRIKVLDGVHYGQEPPTDKDEILKRFKMFYPDNMEILVWHHMTYITPPFPGATGGNAKHILQKYPQYDLIVTGDNHQSFHVYEKNRLLVNPGPITRQKADQINFMPSVYLWYAETNTVEQVFLPIQEGVITREHIEVKQERDARIDAFISRLNTNFEATLSFEENLDMFFQTNKTESDIKQIIYKSLE